MAFPPLSHRTLLLSLSGLVLLLLVLHLFVGSVWMTPQEVSAALVDAVYSLWGYPSTVSAVGQEIVVHHRLTIALTAALSGAALGGSGLFTQTLFRNPLADPSLLGINAGAALGAALAMMMVRSVSLLTGFTLTVFAGRSCSVGFAAGCESPCGECHCRALSGGDAFFHGHLRVGHLGTPRFGRWTTPLSTMALGRLHLGELVAPAFFCSHRLRIVAFEYSSVACA